MSCFCVANLARLPDLNANAALNLSTSAQAALALYGRISLGIPNLPGPTFKLPRLLPAAAAVAVVLAVAVAAVVAAFRRPS